MADGLNDFRAMRIAEVIAHFRSLHQQLSQLQATPPAGQGNEVGYVVLNATRTAAQRTLVSPPADALFARPASNDEQTKRSLQRILLDISARRFRVYWALLRAQAAMRWVSRRQSILQGKTPGPQQTQALNQANSQLTSELGLITDARIYNELRAYDTAKKNWLGEMADLNTLKAYVYANYP